MKGDLEKFKISSMMEALSHPDAKSVKLASEIQKVTDDYEIQKTESKIKSIKLQRELAQLELPVESTLFKNNILEKRDLIARKMN